MQTTNIIVRKRITVLLIVATAALVGLVFRLAWIQLVRGDKLREEAQEVRMRDVPVEARRGNVYDRNGNELVTSVSVDSAYAFPPQIKDKEDAAARIAAALAMDKEEVYQKLTQNVGFVWLKRRIDYQSAQQLKALKLNGVELVEENKRFYRQGSLAAHVLGFAGDDNQGLVGIESIYDKELRGSPGRIVIEKDAVGRDIPEALHKFIPPAPGNNLILTIDQTIQYFVERELDKITETHNPKLAVIIVMDPKTGEILALGNRPTFNPGNWRQYPQQVWDHNPGIWYNYEPGSTFKIITAAAALDEGAVRLADTFYDPGYIKVADRTIRCWQDGGHGSQTFEQVAQNSCNPGFITVGLRLGTEKFYKYINAFGFGQKSNICLPGEEVGILIPQKEATDLNIATMSIGQSIAVTPVQLVTAASAVANDGLLLKPSLVKAITDENGEVIKEFQIETVRQVISKNTARTLLGLLTSVVQKGTGRNAFVDGYGAAGKTGTAQVVGSGGYAEGKYVASFVGFAPADDPRISVLVMVAEPAGSIYFGSQVAAPVFKAVAQDTLRYLKVPERPNLEKPKYPFVYDEPEREQVVPNVVNYPVKDARNVLENDGLIVQIRGQGDMVFGQIPKGGAVVKRGTTVILDLNQPPGTSGQNQVTVPDLRGLTIKEAGTVLEKSGLHLSPAGTGFAVRQDVAPGSKVAKDTIITVEFEPPEIQVLRD